MIGNREEMGGVREMRGIREEMEMRGIREEMGGVMGN